MKRLLSLLPLCLALAVAGTEKLHNDKVNAIEFTLHPGETATMDGLHPAVAVFFTAGSVEFLPAAGDPYRTTVNRGEARFGPALPGSLKNTGAADLHFVTVNFLTGGSDETWGSTGLSPNYKLLIENRYTRVYDIGIPAGTKEPQHTHKARVVICLSGAVLKHLMPDGKEEPSTLRTGEIAWRPGSTHIGKNLGTTDLRVIAVEPK